MSQGVNADLVVLLVTAGFVAGFLMGVIVAVASGIFRE